VDGAIHRAAGSDLFQECWTLQGCETGEAKITKGYRLPALHVIHTVGPVYDEGPLEEVSDLLRSCYYNSLKLAVDNDLRSIAFCSISTGVYGYPLNDATHIALDTTREFLTSPDGEKLDRVVFVTFSDTDRATYLNLLPEYFPFVDPSDAPANDATGAPSAAAVPLPESPPLVTAELLPNTTFQNESVTSTTDNKKLITGLSTPPSAHAAPTASKDSDGGESEDYEMVDAEVSGEDREGKEEGKL